jgi:hypothetical protein
MRQSGAPYKHPAKKRRARGGRPTAPAPPPGDAGAVAGPRPAVDPSPAGRVRRLLVELAALRDRFGATEADAHLRRGLRPEEYARWQRLLASSCSAVR